MHKTREARNEYARAYRKRKRRERGLQKSGRKPTLLTPELVELSKENRKEWEKGWKKQYNQNSPQKRLLWAAKRRAKDKKLPFDLVEEDIVIPTHCPYIGIELSVTAPRGSNRRTVMSLDRIIPELGYIKGNVQVISHLANTMKQDASIQELTTFANHVLDTFTCG